MYLAVLLVSIYRQDYLKGVGNLAYFVLAIVRFCLYSSQCRLEVRSSDHQ